MISNNRSHWEQVDLGNITVPTTAQDVWNKMKEYFKWCDLNPILVPRTALTGKEVGKKFDEAKIRPYNVKALCVRCGLTEEWMNDCLSGPPTEMQHVVKTGLMLIYVQMFEMGMIGEFSPIFTAKALNMDKEDKGPSKITIEYVGELPPLSNSENEVLEKLKVEKGEIKSKTY